MSAHVRVATGPYREPFRRSLTLDVLGHTFSEQSRLAEAAQAASEAARRQHEQEVEDHFRDAVSARVAGRWRWLAAAAVSTASALAWLLG